MNINRRILPAILTASLFLCGIANAEDDSPGTSAASADQASTSQAASKPSPAAGNDLDLTSTTYLWFAGAHGDTGALGYSLGYKASPGDLLSHADFGIMHLFGLRYHRLVVLQDFYWAPFTITRSRGFDNITGQPIVSAKVKYTQVELAVEAGYCLIDSPKLKIDALTGYRYWHNGFTLTATEGGVTNPSRYASTNYADPLVGGRIVVPFTPKVQAAVWGDVGGWGAGAQLDYQLVGALTYQIKPKWGADVAWRYNYTDYGQVIHSINAYSGIVIGVSYSLIAPR